MKQAIASYGITTKQMEGRVYESPRIYLPTKLTTDSAFPFGRADMLYVKVVGKRLLLERAPIKILRKFGRINRKAAKERGRKKNRKKKRRGAVSKA
jgi:hypothetical protein